MNTRSKGIMGNKKVLIIGGGNMGSAFARAFLQSKKIAKQDLTIVEIDSSKIQLLKAELKCKIEKVLPQNFSNYSFVVLAFKPQQLSEMAPLLASKLNSRQVVISILAGINLKVLRKALVQHEQIICCMPNLPVQVGLGATVIYTDKLVRKAHLQKVAALLSSAGSVVIVKKPELLDAATALTASGCGFVFYLIEGFLKTASEFGFTPEQADQLVAQTFLGSTKLWTQNTFTAEEWRKRVTSKGGTTAAGLSIFEEWRIQEYLIAGIKRAYKRCSELREVAK